jgi:hypothetical protein
MTELEQEQEALLLNREMLTEIKNLIDDINHTKPSHLKQFMHPQWGSILGSEEDIRLAALSDEVEIWEQRVGKNPDTIPYLGYIRDTLKGRVKELEDESTNEPQDVYDVSIKVRAELDEQPNSRMAIGEFEEYCATSKSGIR